MSAYASVDLAPSSKLATASSPSSNDNQIMGSNLGRDVLKRAHGFTDNASAIFEYLANAYEAYNRGQRPSIFVDINRNKVVIRDYGVGMTAVAMGKYWTMHGETQRREDGLNLRGYNGTGKVAGFKVAEQIEVRTVKDGLRQISRLNIRTIEHAAATEGNISIEIVEKDVPTTEQNGTVITISTPNKKALPDGFNASFIRDVREKTANEMMMWMKGAEFTINGVPVEASQVPYDTTKEIKSSCGNFVANIYYLEKGYKDELTRVHVSIGDIFVAHEMFGKETHRLGNRVHVTVNTSQEWSKEHFFHRRELFTSESRDLKLKPNCPEAVEYKTWITTTVTDYMKALAEQEEQRRRDEMDEHQRELENRLSMSMSALFRTLHKDVAKRPFHSRSPSIPTELAEVTPRQPPKSKVNVHAEKFSTDEERFRYNMDTMDITINSNYGHMKYLDDNKSVVYDQALTESAIAAFIEMEARRSAAKEFTPERVVPSVDTFFQFMIDTRVKLEREAFTLFGSKFESFKRLSVTKTLADVEEA